MTDKMSVEFTQEELEYIRRSVIHAVFDSGAGFYGNGDKILNKISLAVVEDENND